MLFLNRVKGAPLLPILFLVDSILLGVSLVLIFDKKINPPTENLSASSDSSSTENLIENKSIIENISLSDISPREKDSYLKIEPERLERTDKFFYLGQTMKSDELVDNKVALLEENNGYSEKINQKENLKIIGREGMKSLSELTLENSAVNSSSGQTNPENNQIAVNSKKLEENNILNIAVHPEKAPEDVATEIKTIKDSIPQEVAISLTQPIDSEKNTNQLESINDRNKPQAISEDAQKPISQQDSFTIDQEVRDTISIFGIGEVGDSILGFFKETWFSAEATFEKKVNFLDKINFNKPITLNRNMAGEAKLIAGTKQARITFDKDFFAQKLVITIAPMSFVDGKHKITNVSSEGFDIELEKEQTTDLVFSWHAFEQENETDLIE